MNSVHRCFGVWRGLGGLLVIAAYSKKSNLSILLLSFTSMTSLITCIASDKILEQAFA